MSPATWECRRRLEPSPDSKPELPPSALLRRRCPWFSVTWPESYHRVTRGELHLSVSHRVIVVSCSALLFAGTGVAHSSGPTPKRPAQSAPSSTVQAPARPDIDWAAYNGNVDGQHYSALALINRTNVAQLQVAWQFDTGEKGNLETNPLIVGRVLFGSTLLRESHRPRWRHEANCSGLSTPESKIASLLEASHTGPTARTPGFLPAC